MEHFWIKSLSRSQASYNTSSSNCQKDVMSFLSLEFIFEGLYLNKNLWKKSFHDATIPNGKAFSHALARSLKEYGNSLSRRASSRTPYCLNKSQTSRKSRKCSPKSSVGNLLNCPIVCNIWNIIDFSSNYWDCNCGLTIPGFSSSKIGTTCFQISLSRSSITL